MWSKAERKYHAVKWCASCVIYTEGHLSPVLGKRGRSLFPERAQIPLIVDIHCLPDIPVAFCPRL